VQDILQLGIHPGKLKEMDSISHVAGLFHEDWGIIALFEVFIVDLTWQLYDIH
jgi:hypothetical protein